MTKTNENLIAALRAAFGENDVIQDGAQYWALEALVDALMAGDDPGSEEACGVYEYSAQPHGNGGMAVYRVRPDGYLESVPDYTLREGVHWEGDNIVDNETGDEADLTFAQRYDLATERIADAVLELLDHWRVKEEFEAVQGAHITLDGLKVDWCWELTEGRSILSGDRIFEQLEERPFAWSRCDYVDWVRNILPPDELDRFWGEA